MAESLAGQPTREQVMVDASAHKLEQAKPVSSQVADNHLVLGEVDPMTMSTNDAPAAPVGEADGTSGPRGQRRKGGSPLRKLTDEQEVEITRLYSETDIPVSELASRFGIGESSVYRMVQKYGASLRGRRATGAAATPKVEPAGASAQPVTTPATRGSQRNRPSVGAAASRGTARHRTSRGDARHIPSAAGATSRSSAAVQPPAEAAKGGGLRRFRIAFLAETVVEAETIRDAITKAEALGATDITSVSRAD